MTIDPFDEGALPVGLSAAGVQSSQRTQGFTGLSMQLGLLIANIAALYRGVVTATAAAMTRPADTTAYASGDLVANSTTANLVSPIQLTLGRTAQGVGTIERVRLLKSGTSITNASFRIHFYTSAPTAANGDNGAWSTTTSGYIGSADVTLDKAFTNGAAGIGVPNTGTRIAFKTDAHSKVIYALIEARGAYTPVSAETFTLSAEILQS